MKIDYCDILVVNRNTTFLTNLVLKSIFKNIKSIRYHIYVIDNSDTDKLFQLSDEIQKYRQDISVEVNQSIDWHDRLGSIGHARTIQKFIDQHTDINNLLVVESDAIVTADVDFLDDEYIAAGQMFFGTNMLYNMKPNSEDKTRYSSVKIVPYFMYMNIKKMKQCGINFFSHDLSELPYVESGLIYDTGSNFIIDIVRCNKQISNIDISKYAVHLGAMSRTSSNDSQYQEKLRKAIRLTDYEV